MTDYASDKDWMIHKLIAERDAARAELADMQNRVREIARTTDFTDPALTTALLAAVQHVESTGPGWRLLSTSEERANALQTRLDAVAALCGDKHDTKTITVGQVRAAATGTHQKDGANMCDGCR